MGFFNKYPYTNEHELNLDWIIAKINALKDRVKSVEDALHDIVVEMPNDGKLTIKRNNSIIGDFTANQATDEDINISVPENTSDLNNDSDFITSSDLPDMNNYYDKTETDNLLADKADISSLATVATTGAYADLTGAPDLSTKVNKSGDTMTGRLTIESNTDPLTLQRNTTNGTYILFKNNNGNLGYFGILPNNKPIFSTSNGSDKEIALVEDIVVTTPTNITFTPNGSANVGIDNMTCKRLYGFTLVLLRLKATGTLPANTEINLGTFNNLSNVGCITGVITAQNNTALLGTFIQVNNNLFANFLNTIPLNKILVFTFTTIS